MVTAIFDLDGTIANSIHDLANAVNYGLSKLGYPEHSVESYKLKVGNGAMKLCERALPDDRKSDTGRLHELFREYYRLHYMDNTAAYCGIPELMKKLSDNGVTLAVATNKPQDVAREIVAKLLPEITFVKILGGTDDRPKKPDPAVIREILADMSSDSIVFMIGDSNVDIRTAKNSGLISIGCLWGFRSREELEAEGADHIAASPMQVADIILNETE